VQHSKEHKTVLISLAYTYTLQYSSPSQINFPFPVIVEEAAEVLESHIVTSITKDCEHLVLIGIA
jgi:hypothetical protein